MTDDQEKEIDELVRELGSVNKQSDREFEIRKLDGLRKEPDSIEPDGEITDSELRGRDFRGRHLMAGEKKTWEKLFGPVTRDRQTGSFSEFLRACERRDSNIVGQPSLGGFLVHEQYSKEIFDLASEKSVLLNRCRMIPMRTGNTLHYPATEITSHATSIHGVIGHWRPELGSLTESTPQFRDCTLELKKLAIFSTYSSEFTEDVAGAEGIIYERLAKGLSFYVDKALVSGTGAGDPQGVLNSSSKIDQTAESGQSASTVVLENLVKMLSRMHPGCIGNAMWLCHPSVLPQLYTLSLTIGTGGSAFPALTYQGGQYNLLGKPLHITEQCETLGTSGDIILLDPSQYCVAMRPDFRFQTTSGLYFSTDKWACRLIARLDGQCLWDKALTLKDATTTVSPIITLSTRS